eukprot:gnl/TRDRNA2_/TRDRNA2_81209_c0_seq1.p1 gnl/TRDRNA2_/TRDRNA2_81209_c0~~gnl/TRDRNA2_/TRDRNA2_81209_c0_seq1.p1  ORF type:complete len:378 (-),score=91.89 gnl/TRDRNA2_/TRDRNA2_81209_c0_seq1:131-1180(-)
MRHQVQLMPSTAYATPRAGAPAARPAAAPPAAVAVPAGPATMGRVQVSTPRGGNMVMGAPAPAQPPAAQVTAVAATVSSAAAGRRGGTTPAAATLIATPVTAKQASLQAPVAAVRPQEAQVAAQVERPPMQPVQLQPPRQMPVRQVKEDDPKLQHLRELRRSSGLRHVPVGEAFRALKAAAGPGGLSRDQFMLVCEELLERRGIELPPEMVRHAIFDLFDCDENSNVDLLDLVSGLSLFCAGSEDDKIKAIFAVFGEYGDGYVSVNELFKFLTSVFKVVLTDNVLKVLNTRGVAVESAEELASTTTLECFKAHCGDVSQDKRISIAEFQAWFSSPKHDPALLFAPMRKQ